MWDVVIRNGRIADGTGNPWFYGDVAVKDGRIAAVGGRLDGEAGRVIDAARSVIAPGFIDGHCHSDLMILDQPHSEIKMRQGVTTEVIGNCGLAPAPCRRGRERELRDYVQPVLGTLSRPWPWEGVAEYVETLKQARPAENVSTYVAHGALRIAVMGFLNRPATAVELGKMKSLLEEGMQAGAIGLSIGLLYAPGSYTTKEEIAELCDMLPKYGGLLSTHIRGEGNRLLPSIREVLWIAERAGVPLHVSHLKAAGKRNWGQALAAMELIADARARGMDVTCDVYPYSASSTMLTTLLPPWVMEGGGEAALARLADPAYRKRIADELDEEQDHWDNLVCSTGWDNVIVSSVQSEQNRGLEGRHMAEVAEMRGIGPAECLMDLLLEEKGQVAIVYFLMSDDDVRQIVAWDNSLIASDSLGCETGRPHPRLYGTFPRVFAKYVREDKALSLEQAVRKLTSFPARRFKLGDRGLLVPGCAADLVVFDPETIQDKATFQEPRQYPAGIHHALVRGEVTLSAGALTDARPGQFIAANDVCRH